MTTHKEALTLALEALEYEKGANNPLDWHHDKAITAIKEALAHPEQEPYAWEFAGTIFHDRKEVFDWYERGDISDIPPLALYTAPPQRKPLTDEQIAEFAERMEASNPTDSFWREFARAIEAAHGIKE